MQTIIDREIQDILKEDTAEKRMALPKHYTNQKPQMRLEPPGECKAYNINVPMQWKQYRLMPDELKKKYLTDLRTEKGALNSNLESMLGVSRATLGRELRRLKIPRPSSIKRTSKQLQAWKNFIGCVPTVADIQPVNAISEVVINPPAKADFEQVEISVMGFMDKEMLLNRIIPLLPLGGMCKVNISVQRVVNNNTELKESV